MAKLRVHNVSMSLDGFMAGPAQSLERPIGIGGEGLHAWMFETHTWRALQGADGGTTGIDDDFLREGIEGIGATIMGRNMFGPVRGPWPADNGWRGWWGDDPPFHHPVVVLTHYPHEPMEMLGGTTFYFVTDGIESALDQAVRAAGGRDVRLGGGAATIRAYLRAGLVDSLEIAMVPILLGQGERLFDDLGAATARYRTVKLVSSAAVTHVQLDRV